MTAKGPDRSRGIAFLPVSLPPDAGVKIRWGAVGESARGMDRRPPRIILVHACRAAHTREMHGSSESTNNLQHGCVGSFGRFRESIRDFFVFPIFPRRNRNQLAERSRLTSQTTHLRLGEVALRSTAPSLGVPDPPVTPSDAVRCAPTASRGGKATPGFTNDNERAALLPAAGVPQAQR